MQQKTVPIGKGLFLVRYETAQDVFNPPQARITPEPGSERQVLIVSDPNSSDSILAEPGTCLVVRAIEPARLRVEVIPNQENGSVAATIKVEPLGRSVTLSAPRPEPPVVRPLDLRNFTVLGHVSGIGDVSVRAEEWIAGPTAPSRIEGFAIMWPGKPPAIEISYAARIGGQSPTTTPLAGLGTFAGTRSRALPLVGAVFELSGSLATKYQFIVEGIFLGSPRSFQRGARVVLSGPTGREPMVGLRIGLEQVQVNAVQEPINAIPEPKPLPSHQLQSAPAAAPPPAKPPSRVRVFRSSARQAAGAPDRKD
jgi:hypothetical protein